MKELILRLRHWLIKKLGGYTEQWTSPVVRYPPTVRIIPERVYAQARVSRDMLGDDRDRWSDFSDRVKRELAYKIVEEIIAKDRAVLTCEPDWQNGPWESVYTMMVCILPPSEWMKTTLGDRIAPPVAHDYRQEFTRRRQNKKKDG